MDTFSCSSARQPIAAKQMGVVRGDDRAHPSSFSVRMKAACAALRGSASGPPRKATWPRIGLPQARPLMVWLTTAWKMEAERSSLVAPSLIRGWISDLGENAAAGCDGINSFVIFRVFIQTG